MMHQSKPRKSDWLYFCNTATLGSDCKLHIMPQPSLPWEEPGCAECLFITVPGNKQLPFIYLVLISVSPHILPVSLYFLCLEAMLLDV